MFLRKVHSVLVAIILAFILANLSYEASTFQGNAEDAITDQTIKDSNLQSRNSIQFQFQAYTNIYSEFDVNTKRPNLIRPFQAVVKFTNPPLNTTSLKDNKELELSSIWAKNKTIQHLLPYHGFS